MTGRRVQLTTLELHLLDRACVSLAVAFGGVYLVGTAQDGEGSRDVDVRVILPDEEFDKHFAGNRPLWGVMCLAIGLQLRAETGLPVDFQIQRMTEANERHAGKQRNPLGRRTLANWIGDAAPDRT